MSEFIRLNPGRLTPYGWSLVKQQAPLGLVAAGIGNAVENKILDHLVANSTYSAPSPYLALWTSALDDTSTAATSGELSYTTYARQAISSTNMSPAASGSVTNDVAVTFAAVTAGGGTVTYWMLASSSSGAGDSICWGTATSTVISTTQTPPVVAIGGLVITLD